MKVFIASIVLDYVDGNGEVLRHEITRVYSTYEKAMQFVAIGGNDKEMSILWEEEIRSNSCLFDTDKLDEVLAFGIDEREVL